MEHGKKLMMGHTTNELTDDIRLCVLKNEKYAYKYCYCLQLKMVTSIQWKDNMNCTN